MQLSYALKHPESRTILRLARRYGSYMRLLIVLTKGRLTKDVLKHPRLVRLLLAQGAKVETKDKFNKTPLNWASRFGHVEVCGILLTYGAAVDIKDDDRRVPLHWASKFGHIDVCRLLLTQGALVYTNSNKGWTPLHIEGRAYFNGMFQTRGVDANDCVGWTPLHLASMGGHVNVCGILLTYGASINAKDFYGSTPLDWASDNGHANVCALLRAHGAI